MSHTSGNKNKREEEARYKPGNVCNPIRSRAKQQTKNKLDRQEKADQCEGAKLLLAELAEPKPKQARKPTD
jgi:hypothetical protein